MHQVGRGERMSVAFAPEPESRDAAQLAVHPRQQLLERGGIARRVRVQESGDLRCSPGPGVGGAVSPRTHHYRHGGWDSRR